MSNNNDSSIIPEINEEEVTDFGFGEETEGQAKQSNMNIKMEDYIGTVAETETEINEEDLLSSMFGDEEEVEIDLNDSILSTLHEITPVEVNEDDNFDDLELIASLKQVEQVEKEMRKSNMLLEDVNNLKKSLNAKITHYNAIQYVINWRRRAKFTKTSNETFRTNKLKREKEDEGYNKDNYMTVVDECKLVQSAIDNDFPIDLDDLKLKISVIPNELVKILSKTIGTILENQKYVIHEETNKIVIEDTPSKYRISEALHKIQSTMEPKIGTEKNIEDGDAQLLDEKLSSEEFNLTRNNIRVFYAEEEFPAIYNITRITEVLDSRTSIASERNYYEITANRVYVGKTDLTAEDYDNTYKEKLLFRVPTSKLNLSIEKVINRGLKGMIDGSIERQNKFIEELNKVEGVEFHEKITATMDSEIINPVMYQYKKALVTFTNDEVYKKFKMNTAEDFRKVYQDRMDSPDFLVGIVANFNNMSDIFRKEEKSILLEYPKYTRAEIKDRLSNKVVNASTKEFYENITETGFEEMGNELAIIKPDTRFLHQFNTPCRDIFQQVIKKYQVEIEEIINSSKDNVIDSITPIFEKHKEEIVSETVKGSLKFLNSFIETLEDTESFPYAIAVDFFTYGEDVLGLVPRYFKRTVIKNYEDLTTEDKAIVARAEGKAVELLTDYENRKYKLPAGNITLTEFLSDKERINSIELADLLGTNRKRYNKRDTTDGQTTSMFKVGSGKDYQAFLSAVDNLKVEIDDKQILKKGDNNMDSELIKIKSTSTQAEYVEHLVSIIDKTLEFRKLPQMKQEDKEIMAAIYTTILNPVDKEINVDKINLINPRKVDLSMTDEEINKCNSLEMKLDDLKNKLIYREVVLGEDDSPIVEKLINDWITSEEIAKELQTDKWLGIDLTGTALLKDISNLIPLTELVEGATYVIYKALQTLEINDIDKYQAYTLQESLNIPNPSMVASEEVSTHRIGVDPLTSLTSIKEIMSDFSIQTMRDLTFFNDFLSNKAYFNRYNRATEMKDKQMSMLKTSGTLYPVPEKITLDIEKNECGITAEGLFKYVDKIISEISLTELERRMIWTTIRTRCMLFNKHTARVELLQELSDYKVKEEDIQHIVPLRMIENYIIAMEILPIGMIIKLQSEIQKMKEELMSTLEKVPVVKLNQREVNSLRSKNNIYYKTFLLKNDKKFLEKVDRNYVDFELLTQKPTIVDNKESLGGEYSTVRLLEKYPLNDDDISEMFTTDEIANRPEPEIFELLLLMERKYRNNEDGKSIDIIEELPQPILDYMSSVVINITNKDVISSLAKETKFNLNFKATSDN